MTKVDENIQTAQNMLSGIVERCYELEEENKKLKEDNRFLTKISKEYMEKENIIEVTEFTQLYKDDLEEENRKLKEELEKLKSNYVYDAKQVRDVC